MPTYSYHCEACGADFEREQRISEDPIKKCTRCGKLKARRMIASSGNFILKGGGWYSDGYGSGSSKSSSSTTSTTTTTTTTTETKAPSSDSAPPSSD